MNETLILSGFRSCEILQEMLTSLVLSPSSCSSTVSFHWKKLQAKSAFIWAPPISFEAKQETQSRGNLVASKPPPSWLTSSLFSRKAWVTASKFITFPNDVIQIVLSQGTTPCTCCSFLSSKDCPHSFIFVASEYIPASLFQHLLDASFPLLPGSG